MNVKVEASPLTLNVDATFVECSISTKLNSGYAKISINNWTCFTLTPISVNGHSLSGINPEVALIGGMTTSAVA